MITLEYIILIFFQILWKKHQPSPIRLPSLLEKCSVCILSFHTLAEPNYRIAVGPIESLTARYPIYEIHFSCRTREEVLAAQQLMARIPGSRMADDVATRFEVPLGGPESHSLAGLFRFLSEHGQFSEYTVERVSLESIFLKVIRANNIKEEDSSRARQWWRVC